MRRRCFIIHSRVDKPFLRSCKRALRRTLARDLDDRGAVRLLVDEDVVGVEDTFEAPLVSALRGADVVALLWSANAATSAAVAQELAELHDEQKSRSLPLVPVLLDNTPLPIHLRMYVQVDLRSMPPLLKSATIFLSGTLVGMTAPIEPTSPYVLAVLVAFGVCFGTMALWLLPHR